MAKYKDLPEDVRHLKDAISRKWIGVISVSAFMALGIWMLIDPESPDHSSVEKGTVYVMKEIWSFEAGLIITGMMAIFLYFPLRRIMVLYGKVWIKWDNGYYFFDRKQRKSGLGSLYNGDDLIVFYPEKDMTLKLFNYTNAPIAEYQPVGIDTEFNCQDAFWNANQDGYSVFYRGEYVPDTTFERRDKDLIVTSSKLNLQFKLENYDQLRDNKIRKAIIPSRNHVV